MKKQALTILLFLVSYLLFNNTYSQITRGAVPGELYISTSWFADIPHGVRYGIFHSTDNGAHITPMYSSLETPPPDEMTIGKVVGDATPGALYNYGNNELWVSFDEGVNWEFVENYSYSGEYTSGGTNGEIYKNGTDAEGTIFRSINYGNEFTEVSNNAKYTLEVGNSPGNLFGLDGGAVEGYLIQYSIDYGESFIEIPIDSSVAYWQIGGYHPKISRGTEPGELYLVSWWLDYHYKIFHSTDTGHTWTQQYESGYIDTYYWRVAYTAGREPGSFYVKRSRINPAGDHVWLYIDYSSDYGQTFTTYFYDLVPDFTSVNSIEKPDMKLSNYPNPFDSNTSFNFNVPDNATNMFIEIYDLNSGLIKRIRVSENHSISWDGTGLNGKKVKEGVYFYSLKADNKTLATNKLIYLN